MRAMKAALKWSRSRNRVALKRQYFSFVCCMFFTDTDRHTRRQSLHDTQIGHPTPLEQEMTIAHKNIRIRKRAAGMARFFSQSNRERYRKLASGMISQAEQHQLLEDLAEEMVAFKREARCCLSPAAERSTSHSRDRI